MHAIAPRADMGGVIAAAVASPEATVEATVVAAKLAIHAAALVT